MNSQLEQQVVLAAPETGQAHKWPCFARAAARSSVASFGATGSVHCGGGSRTWARSAWYRGIGCACSRWFMLLWPRLALPELDSAALMHSRLS